MKKSLVVRAAAIVMMLCATFFLLVPDMVRADGEAFQEPATEVTAEVPESETPEAEQPAPENPETPEAEPISPETPAETPTEEEPLPEEPAEIPEDNSEIKEEVAEAPVEEVPPSTEASTEESKPAADVPAVETVPETPAQTPVSVDVTAAEEQQPDMSRLEEIRKNAEVSTKTVTPIGEDKLVIGNDSVEGYVIEGTTITGYQGAGGHIVIPDGITTIGDNAFFGNTTITGVTFPGSLQTIGSSAFNGCSNLAEISIPASVTTVGVSAFANCTGLTVANLTASTGTIVQGEFYNCVSLTSIAVPEGISSVASEAFGSCSNLTAVSLPASLASLDMNAFAGDVNLASISVAAGNGSYSSYDGCLYTANGTKLLLCPAGKTSVTLNSGIAGISSGAFTGCNYLTSVAVPASASTIETNAFAGSAIKSVTIPTEVTAIGTQDSWTPSVVYGYNGSVAESWADENNYVFESLDGSSNNDNDDDDDNDDNDDDDDGNDSPGGGVNGNSGTNTTTVTAAEPSATSGTTATISQNADSHVKDATPKTGVEDYGRYFLFASIMLMGVAFFAYSMKLSYEGK